MGPGYPLYILGKNLRDRKYSLWIVLGYEDRQGAAMAGQRNPRGVALGLERNYRWRFRWNLLRTAGCSQHPP
jgi:hypothetical protein